MRARTSMAVLSASRNRAACARSFTSVPASMGWRRSFWTSCQRRIVDMNLLIVGISAIIIFTLACFINISIERNKRRERYLAVISPVRGENSRNEEANKLLAKQRAELAKKLKHVSD